MLQVLGAAVLAVLYPLASPFYTAGIMLFDLGVLLAAFHLLVWITWVRTLILGAVLAGIPLQLLGQWLAPPQFAGAVILAGIALVCIAAAGMAGREAYCFSWPEGWALMWLLPALALLNLAAGEHVVLNALGFSAAFLLLLSLGGRKLRQPVRSRSQMTEDRPWILD